MKKYVLFAAISFSMVSSKAQTNGIVSVDSLCVKTKFKLEEALMRVAPVDDFKDSVTLYLAITEIAVGAVRQNVSINIEEHFSNESKIYQLGDQLAISISVSRVFEGGQKFYVQKLNLFRKTNGCWRNETELQPWSKFNLGQGGGGYYYGTEGTENYIGFSAKSIIK